MARNDDATRLAILIARLELTDDYEIADSFRPALRRANAERRKAGLRPVRATQEILFRESV
jgi:hypothetical protein